MTRGHDRDVDVQLQVVRDAAVHAKAVRSFAVQVIGQLVPEQERDDERDDDGPNAAPGRSLSICRVGLLRKGRKPSRQRDRFARPEKRLGGRTFLNASNAVKGGGLAKMAANAPSLDTRGSILCTRACSGFPRWSRVVLAAVPSSWPKCDYCPPYSPPRRPPRSSCRDDWLFLTALAMISAVTARVTVGAVESATDNVGSGLPFSKHTSGAASCASGKSLAAVTTGDAQAQVHRQAVRYCSESERKRSNTLASRLESFRIAVD